MINGYEIRENTVTPNSVFLLLLKADEAGCKEIEDKLSAFCKLTNLQMKGFDYVFELSGITDDSMLEKLRSRIDFISSSVMGVTQTFANPLKTGTITLTSSTNTMPQIEGFAKNKNKTYTPEDVFASNTLHPKAEIPSLDSLGNKDVPSLKLADTGFPLSQEKPVTELKDLSFNPELASDEMTEVAVEGNALKIEKTIPEISSNTEEQAEPEHQSHMAQIETEELTGVEAENQTVISFTPEEMKNVAISIEKPREKKSLFGGIFNKVKSF